jgi:antitoxin component of MazEF toxin-antitoxin module|tara:strand:+ start:59 stop:256 length:198 start_codon:yes stop_codon:yes gene_type:complete
MYRLKKNKMKTKQLVAVHKLHDLGKSLAAVLPKSWVKQVDLKKGDRVAVYQTAETLELVPLKEES